MIRGSIMNNRLRKKNNKTFKINRKQPVRGVSAKQLIIHLLWELAEVSRIFLVLVIDHMPVRFVGFDALQKQTVERVWEAILTAANSGLYLNTVSRYADSGYSYNLKKIGWIFDFHPRPLFFLRMDFCGLELIWRFSSAGIVFDSCNT